MNVLGATDILEVLRKLDSWSELRDVCALNRHVRQVCIDNKDIILANVYNNKYRSEEMSRQDYWTHGDRPGMVRESIRLGANATIANNTPVLRAAELGYILMLRVLHQNGANIHTENDRPLKLAARNGRMDVVVYLLEHGADTHEDDPANNILMQAILSRNVQLVDYLHQVVGMDLHNNEDNALMLASGNGDVAMVTYLLDNGVDVNSQDSLAFVKAVENGSVGLINLLIERGATITDLAVLEASTQDSDVLQRVLQAGGNPNADNGEALILTIDEEHQDNVRVLLSHGANVTGAAMEAAVLEGNVNIFRLLHEHGGELTPALLSTAAVNNAAEIARYLVRHGVGIESDEYDALLTAVEWEHMDTVYAMLEETDQTIPDDIIEELLEIRDDLRFQNYIRQFSENYTEG